MMTAYFPIIGWHVERGDLYSIGLLPDLLISLTSPKLCAHYYSGRYHTIGGRFIPPVIADKYQLNVPRFPGAQQFIQVPVNPHPKSVELATTTSSTTTTSPPSSL
jgi:hypothetical protein